MPAVFGPAIHHALPLLASGTGTLFSHAHAWVCVRQGRVAGMLLGYTGREKAAEDPRTGLALLRALGPGLLLRLGRLLRLQGMIGGIGAGEYYVSNVAVYPEDRGSGLGAALLAHAEAAAPAAGASAMVLDVETDNAGALRLYERSGYRVRSRTPYLLLEGRPFSFCRMEKPLPWKS